MENKFDIKALQNRIAEVKKEIEEASEFTQLFLECLIKRHDLPKILDGEYNFDEVPDCVLSDLKDGKIPSKNDLSLMDAESQDYFVKDCVWIAGMGAIAWYCENEEKYQEIKPSPFDEIIKMPDISPGHHTASYLIAAFTLLHADIPMQEFIEILTNNFDCSQEQLESNMELYNELCVAILRRYKEDLNYYVNEE
jgi:hypothetical protein